MFDGRRAGCLIVWLWLTTAFTSHAVQPERATIGVLIDLHFPGPKSRSPPTTGVSSNGPCGPLNEAQFQHLMAAEWAAQVVSNQSDPQGIHIGIDLFDTCGDADRAMRDVPFAVKSALDPRRKVPLLGLIGLGDPDVVSETVTNLHAFNIPLILASPRLTEMVNQEGNILTSAPDISGVVKPVLMVAKQMGVKSVSVISTCPYSIKKFGQSAADQGILIGRILQLEKHSKVIGDVIRKFLDESDINETIALILEPEEIYTLGEQLRSYEHPQVTLITGVIGLNKNLLKLWKDLFAGSYLVEPHMPELPEFRNYLLSLMQSAQTEDKPFVREYMASVYSCQWEKSNNVTTACQDLQFNDLAQKLQINPEVTFVVKAVSAYSAALFLHCHDRTLPNCTYSGPGEDNFQQEILTTLSQLSFTSQHNVPFELQGTSHRVTHEGQLIPNKYVIYQVEQMGDVSQLGWYSDDQGLALDETVASKLTHRDGRKRLLTSEIQGRAFDSQSFPKFSIIKELELKGHMIASLGSEDVDARRVTPESSIARPWATVIVAIAAVGIFITLFIIVYVLLKICDGTLSGNQSLGLLLLLGVLVLYASIVLFVMPASETRCAIRSFLHPIALSLCYGILIIKVMQLRSLVLLGLGGRISYINQYIILFFIVLVQVVVNVQWFLSNRPQCRLDASGTATCRMSREDFLLLHLYTVILLIIAFFYGLSVLKIRRNYKEGHWVTLAAFLSFPVFLVWGLVYSMAPEKFDEPANCIALIVLASVLIMAIFIPKMSTISKQSKHFKHKKIQMANSVTTVFTTYTDLHNSSGHSSGRKKYLKSPSRTQTLNASMLDAYSDNITKNPIYEVTNGGYP